jgi:hypothetical protein
MGRGKKIKCASTGLPKPRQQLLSFKHLGRPTGEEGSDFTTPTNITLLDKTPSPDNFQVINPYLHCLPRPVRCKSSLLMNHSLLYSSWFFCCNWGSILTLGLYPRTEEYLGYSRHQEQNQMNLFLLYYVEKIFQ